MVDAEEARNEALRLQMEQAMELVRQMQGNIVQAAGFFIAADTLLLGYGVSQKKAGALLLACFTVLGIFGSMRSGLKFLGPAVYAGLYAERLLLPNDVTLLASLMRIRYPAIYDRLNAVLSIQDIQQREHEIRHAISDRNLLRGFPVFRALSVLFLLQLAAFFLALIVFNYSFF